MGLTYQYWNHINGYKEKFIYGNKHIDRAYKSAVIKV